MQISDQNLKEIIWRAFVSLQSRSTGEVARPERMITGSVREEVIRLRCVGLIEVSESKHVARGRRVDNVHLTALSLLQ